eukprot:32895_6
MVHKGRVPNTCTFASAGLVRRRECAGSAASFIGGAREEYAPKITQRELFVFLARRPIRCCGRSKGQRPQK